MTALEARLGDKKKGEPEPQANQMNALDYAILAATPYERPFVVLADEGHATTCFYV